jgi:hypothetical protein
MQLPSPESQSPACRLGIDTETKTPRGSDRVILHPIFWTPHFNPAGEWPYRRFNVRPLTALTSAATTHAELRDSTTR